MYEIALKRAVKNEKIDTDREQESTVFFCCCCFCCVFSKLFLCYCSCRCRYLEGQLSMLYSLTLPLALFTFCCYRHPILKAAQGIIHHQTKSERDACLNEIPHKSSLPSSTRSLLEEENDMESSTDRKERLSSVDNCENDAFFVSPSSGGSNARLNECNSRPLDRDLSESSGLSSEESYSDETPFSFPDIPTKSLQQLPLARILCGTQSLDDFSSVFEKDSIASSTNETRCKEVLSPWMQEKNSSHELSQDQGTIESCALSSSKNFGSSLENPCLCFEQTSPVNFSSSSSVIRDSPLSPIQLASFSGCNVCFRFPFSSLSILSSFHIILDIITIIVFIYLFILSSSLQKSYVV